MRLKEISSEVFRADGPIVKVSRTEVEFLKDQVHRSPRGRVRLCAHPGNDDLLHEMIIVLSRETYIRPHKHPMKSESFHVIEGMVDVVVLDDQGQITEVIQLGDLASGRKFFYRISQPLFHTLLIRSPLLIIHETTNGPFSKGDAIFATWAPEEGSPASSQYCAELESSVRSHLERLSSTHEVT